MYKVGDVLHLREYIQESDRYTGQETDRQVTFVLREFAGLQEGFVILGLKDLDAEQAFTHRIVMTVREWMVAHYGEGVNLAGHCIEASELIHNILVAAGLEACTVEGWVRYDDTRYAEYAYDCHTWVEVTLNNRVYYVDVTADQFNYGMDPEFKFSGVIIQEGYPHGVTLTLPENEEQ